MKLEEGKFYRARGGRKMGPLAVYDEDPRKLVVWSAEVADDPEPRPVKLYTEQGSNLRKQQYDLVAEWVDADEEKFARLCEMAGVKLPNTADVPEAVKNWPDPVNSPSHYNTGGIECFDAMSAMLTREEMIGYLRGNSFKYRWRFRHKGGAEDLRKAEWYEKKLLDLIENSA